MRLANPVDRGEDCRLPIHRPSLGGTPTWNCPNCTDWTWDDPDANRLALPPPVPEPTDETLTRVAVRRSWWQNHDRRVIALTQRLDEIMEPLVLQGPTLEPFVSRPSGEQWPLGHLAPRVRFVCPRGHLIDDVVAVRDNNVHDGGPPWWDLRSKMYFQDGGLKPAAPWAEGDQTGMVLELRVSARCQNRRCKYDGRKTLEELLKLYALAVTTRQREVRLLN